MINRKYKKGQLIIRKTHYLVFGTFLRMKSKTIVVMRVEYQSNFASGHEREFSLRETCPMTPALIEKLEEDIKLNLGNREDELKRQARLYSEAVEVRNTVRWIIEGPHIEQSNRIKGIYHELSGRISSWE
jgi:hypothetical protein